MKCCFVSINGNMIVLPFVCEITWWRKECPTKFGSGNTIWWCQDALLWMLQRYIKYTTHGFPKYIFLMQSLVIYLKYVYLLYCNKAWAKSPHIIEEQKKWQHFKRAVTAEASHAFGQPRILWAAKCVQSSNINILVKCYLGQFGSVLGIEPGPPGWDPCVLTTGPYHSH